MGRKKKIDPDKVLEDVERLKEQMNGEEAPLNALDREADARDLDVHTFLSQFGESDLSVRITRQEAGKLSAYCGTIPLSGCTERAIQEAYGDGEYKCTMLDPDGKYLRSRVVRIVNTPPKPLGQPSGQPPGQSSEQSSINLFLSTQLQMFREEMASQRQMMMQMLASRNSNDRDSFGEIAEAMKSLKDVVRPPEGKSTTESLKELIDVFNKGMELGMQSAGKGPTGWLGVARDALDVLPGALRALKLGATSQAGGPVPDNAAPQLQGISPQVAQTLKAGIEYLKSRVRIGQGYQLWTDFIVANLDNPQWAAMAHLLDRPLEDLAAIDPEIVNPLYKPWFEGLLGDLRNAIRSQADTGGQGSDAGGSSGNEASDPGSPAK